jgi:hypothetical protein
MMMWPVNKMNNSCGTLGAIVVIALLFASEVIECQRPSSGGRLDVYIAG